MYILKFPSETFEERKILPSEVNAIMLHYTNTKIIDDSLDLLIRKKDNRINPNYLNYPSVSSHYLVTDFTLKLLVEEESEETLINYLNLIRNFDPEKIEQNFEFVKNNYLKILLKYSLTENRVQLINSIISIIYKEKLNEILILELVDPGLKSYHAGKGSFKNIENFNEISIGIEIQYSGHENTDKYFPELQKYSVLELCNYLKNIYPIDPNLVIGHSDYAPQRKIDPGENFNYWGKLAELNLSIYPKIDSKFKNVILAKAGEKGGKILLIQEKLKKYGYDLKVTSILDQQTERVIWAFHSRFNQDFTEKLDFTQIISDGLPKIIDLKWSLYDELMIDKLITAN